MHLLLICLFEKLLHIQNEKHFKSSFIVFRLRKVAVFPLSYIKNRGYTKDIALYTPNFRIQVYLGGWYLMHHWTLKSFFDSSKFTKMFRFKKKSL